MPPSTPNRRRSPAAQAVRERPVEDPRTPAAWLVLALLIEQPSHGYEISQRYRQRFGSIQPMSVPRVYGALDRLQDMGMIEPVTLKPADPSGKQHRMRRSYRATRGGARAYRRWVAERMRDDPQRAELLSRIASAGVLGIDALLDIVDRYQRECVDELRTLPTGSEQLHAGRASLDELTEALIFDQQRRELRARNDWAVHARELLEAHKEALAQGEGGAKGSR
jgi:DNA-binding PadR family transcriptional regulator